MQANATSHKRPSVLNRNIHAMTGSKNLPFTHWNNWSSAALFLLLSCSMLIKPSNYLAPLIVLIASALTWRTWRNDTQRLPRAFRWFLWATCLLAASWLIDNLFSSAHWRNFTLDKPLKVIALLPCAAYLLRYPPKSAWLWIGAAVGAMACGLFAIYQVQVLHYPRAGGHYINPIEFGDTSTQLALLCLCGTQAIHQHPRRLPCLVLMVAGFTLGVVGSVLSGTRGAWLAGLAGLTFLAWWYLGRYSKRLLALVMLAVCLTALLFAQYGPVHQRLQVMHQEIRIYRTQGNAATSIGARLQMWQFASNLAQRRPLVGWAQKGYDSERKQQLEEGRLDPFLASFNHPHNDYLDAAAKRGLPGLLILLSCHLFAFAYFWQAARRTSSACPPALQAQRLALCAAGMLLPVLFASFGLSDTHITSSRTLVMYFFLAAFIMALIETETVTPAGAPHSSWSPLSPFVSRQRPDAGNASDSGAAPPAPPRLAERA